MRGTSDLDAVQRRVLGALVEKGLSTPDQYPLSRTALVAACNQATSRDPVVAYDEATVRTALDELGDRRLTRAASGPGSRAPKHRHLLRETLGLERDAQAILALLLLRGPQTVAELRQRSPRLHAFADAEAVEATLHELADRDLVADVGRRPGERGTRWAHRMGGEDAAAQAATQRAPADDRGDATRRAPADDPGDATRRAPVEPTENAARPPSDAPGADDLGARVDALERDLAAAREEIATLRAALEALRGELGA